MKSKYRDLKRQLVTNRHGVTSEDCNITNSAVEGNKFGPFLIVSKTVRSRER